MPLTRHPLNNFLRDSGIVLAALESFVEQFNSEIGNLLSSAFGNLFFDFATTEFNVRNRRGQNRAAFLQLLVAHRFSPFGNSDYLYKVVRGDSGSRFASENVIQARQRTAFVVEPIIVEERIANTPSGKTIENNVELVFGRAFSRRSVPGEDTLVKTVHFIDHGQFDLQSRACDRTNDFAETRDDHSFILRDNEKQRSPFERGQNEKNPQDRHQSALQKAHNGRNSRGSRGDIDNVHWDALV